MLPTLVGCSAILLWSCLAVLTAATGPMPPFELASLTFGLGGVIGTVISALRGRLGTFKQPLSVWAVGVGGLFGYHALYFAALRQAPPAQAGLIAYLWPLLIVLMAASLPGERLAVRHVLGALLGLAGVSCLILARDGAEVSLEVRYATGYALAAGCALVWSAYSVLSRRFRNVPTDAVGGFCLATAGLAALAHALFEPTVWPNSTGQALAVLGLGIGPVGLAFYVWDIGVKHGDIRVLGVASYAAPLLSTLTLVAFGFTAASTSLAIACLLIVSGAVVASVRAARRASPRGPATEGEGTSQHMT